jgi:hypothetical protein
MAEPLHVVVDDDTETIRVDPETGTVETDRPDGSVVVRLDAHKPKAEDEDAENEWFRNLADDIDAQQLATFAEDLIDAIDADNRSRSEYLEICARGLGLLGTKLESPRSSVDSSVDGMSTVTNPLLLEAVLKGWANAQAELLPASGPVKIKDDGDETAQEDDLAEAYQRDMNHWFTTTAAEYYPDTSHMLLWGTYLKGSGFKKVYRCPMRRRPVSESVETKDLIVSNTTKDFRSCARVTHQIPMRPSVMKRMKLIKAYRDVELTQPTPTPNVLETKVASMQGTTPQRARPEDQDYTLYETQCELDLDEFIPAGSKFKGEGIPLPYLVTIDKDSHAILAIRRDWNEDDAECQRKRMYVKYPYVPGPGFYGTGLLNILGNSSAAMTAAWRLSFDSAMFANFPAGFVAKDANRQNTSNVRQSPGDWAPIETGGKPIGNILLPNPYKDVTPGMMALIKEITEQSKAVGGSADIPTAEGIQNVPVGTMLASIEQATKIMAAAHKGMHTAQSEELELIIDLFRENPEDFWRNNKVCPKDYWSVERFNAALENCNLVPVSDPNVPSHIHRIAKALGLIQLLAVPEFKPLLSAKEVLMRCLRAMREDSQGLVVDPPPVAAGPQIEPDKLITAQARMKDAETKAKKAEVDAATSQGDNQVKLEEIAGRERIAKVNLERDLVIHAHDAERAAASQTLAERAQVHDEAKTTLEHHHAQDELQHTKALEIAQHALETHKVLNPPKPTAPKKSK